MSNRVILAAVFVLLGTGSAGAARRPVLSRIPTEKAPASAAAVNGMGVNLPVVARLIGAGSTLYISTVDVANNNTVPTEVDFYFDGVDLKTFAVVAQNGSISSTGALVAQGTGGLMRARFNAHFDDFIDAMVQAGLLSSSIETDGFIGSVLFVFNNFTKRGQGSAQVRFYNSFGGGTIGEAVKGHEITTNEPQSLVAAFRDSRGKPGPQLYANMFINNTGLTPTGSGVAGTVSIHIQAYANSTGQPTGTPLDTQIGVGETVGVSDVLAQLKVPTGEDTILVFVTVTSGTSAIAGISAGVDNVTRNASTVDMSRADF